MEIRFLNIDLELESSDDLRSIVEHFGENGRVLFHGKNASGFNFASFEISSGLDTTANVLMSKFCLLIENLSAESRRIWDQCAVKRLDIGFQSGDFPKNYQTEIGAETVERVARLGASIVITLYPRYE